MGKSMKKLTEVELNSEEPKESQKLEVVLSLEETRGTQTIPTIKELEGKTEEPRRFNQGSSKQEEKAPTIEEIFWENMQRGDPPPGRISTAKGFVTFINAKPLASRQGFAKDAEGQVNPEPLKHREGQDNPDLQKAEQGQVNPNPREGRVNPNLQKDKQGRVNPKPLEDTEGKVNPDPLENKQGRLNSDPANVEALKDEEVLLEGSDAEGRMEDEEGQPQAGASITGPREDSDCLPNLDLRSELDGKHVGDVGYKWMDRIIDYFIVRSDLRFRRILRHKKGDHISCARGKEIMMEPLYS
jgi:hypothetical protein